MNANDYTGPKRRYAACWPRVMQVGLIADAEIRNSDKYPAGNAYRMSRVPAVWRYAASAVGPTAICWSAYYYLGRPNNRSEDQHN